MTTSSTEREYKCFSCGEVFIGGWTDQEAREEQQKNFPGKPDSEMEVVCETCFQKVMRDVGCKDFAGKK